MTFSLSSLADSTRYKNGTEWGLKSNYESMSRVYKNGYPKLPVFCFCFSLLITRRFFKVLKSNLESTYRNDPKFSDRYAWANSADPDQTAPRGAVWSGSTLFAILSALFGLITLWKSHIVQIRVITTNFLGVRIFRKFTVPQNFTLSPSALWLIDKFIMALKIG